MLPPLAPLVKADVTEPLVTFSVEDVDDVATVDEDVEALDMECNGRSEFCFGAGLDSLRLFSFFFW
jgi:hypothetical protein